MEIIEKLLSQRSYLLECLTQSNVVSTVMNIEQQIAGIDKLLLDLNKPKEG